MHPRQEASPPHLRLLPSSLQNRGQIFHCHRLIRPRLRIEHRVAAQKLPIRQDHLFPVRHSDQKVKMVAHQTVGQHLHSGKVRHLPQLPAQPLLRNRVEQKFTVNGPIDTVIDRARSRNLETSNSQKGSLLSPPYLTVKQIFS